MIDYGIPTLIEIDCLRDHFELAKRVGARFIEINLNLPQFIGARLDVPLLKRLSDDYGTILTMHLDENFNPFDFDPVIAQAYCDQLERCIETARALCAKKINMHMPRGVYFTLPQQKVFLFQRYRDEFLHRVADFQSRFADRLMQSGIMLCIENTQWHDQTFLGEAVDMLLQSPAFALTFDVGHSAACGDRDRQFLLDRSDRILHMHLHQAIGKTHHLPLDHGEIDLEKDLDFAERRGCTVVVEVKTVEALTRSFDWLRARDRA